MCVCVYVLYVCVVFMCVSLCDPCFELVLMIVHGEVCVYVFMCKIRCVTLCFMRMFEVCVRACVIV